MKSNVLPTWMYNDPYKIADGLIARTRRLELVQTPKPVVRQRKDRYYTQSRAIEISAMVAWRKQNGGTR